MSIQAVGHFLIAAHFWFGCWYDWHYVKIPSTLYESGDSAFKTHKLKFLTYWDALLQSTFFTICFVNDLCGTNENFPKNTPLIRKIKDFLLPCLAFPLSMFVGATFWGLYAVDRELIFPKFIDQFFPWWLNHLMHTNVIIFTLLEMLTSYRKYPSRKVGVSVFITFMLTYLIWMHIIYAYTNLWVYPVFNVLNFPARICFFIGNLIIALILYVVGEKINHFWWERRGVKKQHKK